MWRHGSCTTAIEWMYSPRQMAHASWSYGTTSTSSCSPGAEGPSASAGPAVQHDAPPQPLPPSPHAVAADARPITTHSVPPASPTPQSPPLTPFPPTAAPPGLSPGPPPPDATAAARNAQQWPADEPRPPLPTRTSRLSAAAVARSTSVNTRSGSRRMRPSVAPRRPTALASRSSTAAARGTERRPSRRTVATRERMVMAPQKGSPGGAAPPVGANEEAAGEPIPDPDGEGAGEGERGDEEDPPLGNTRGLAEVATRTVSMMDNAPPGGQPRARWETGGGRTGKGRGRAQHKKKTGAGGGGGRANLATRSTGPTPVHAAHSPRLTRPPRL